MVRILGSSRPLGAATFLSLSVLCGATGADHAQPALTPGVVAADHSLASWAGAHILSQGGNAVDAAVATSFALSVVRPESCGIGGGGFMVIHLRDDPRTPQPNDPVNIAIDYRERAPAAITPTHFHELPDGSSQHTGHAVAIPSTVAGLMLALETFGTMSPQQVLQPAIQIARVGWIVDDYQHKALVELAAHAKAHADDYTEAERAFIAQLTAQGNPMAGELLTNPAQARVLQRIAEQGSAGFYEGPVAEAIIQTIQHHQGVMTIEDLTRTSKATITQPIVRTLPGWENRTIITMPLPSSGGITLIQMLTMLDARRTDLEAAFINRDPQAGTRAAHLIAEVMKHAFADRSAFLGDSEFTPIDIQSMLDDTALRDRAMRIRLDQTLPITHYGTLGDRAASPDPTPQLPDDAGTSHFSVLDRQGNAVSCTETINLLFGSKIPVAPFGFFLNNEMDDFTTRPGEPNAFGLQQSARNAPEAGKRPLSSMTPTIVLDADGQVELVVGASGGPRIITATMQTILRCFLHGNDHAQMAVEAARMHHQWQPDILRLESPAHQRSRVPELPITASQAEIRVWTLQAYDAADLPFSFNHRLFGQLRALGHTLASIDIAGVVQLIAVSDSEARGYSDPRKGGLPAEARTDETQ